MYCKFKKTREQMVKKYNITPLTYTKLLKGQIRKSCAQRVITDKYYCFSYENKFNTKDTGTFLCGEGAGKHFLELINKPAPPLFNVLKSLTTTDSNHSGDNSKNENRWNETARQLSNAIDLLIICWGTSIREPLISFKKDLNKFPSAEPYPSKIKAVNKIISFDKKGRKLINMIEELRKENPDMKEFSFNKLNDVLNKEEIESYFE